MPGLGRNWIDDPNGIRKIRQTELGKRLEQEARYHGQNVVLGSSVPTTVYLTPVTKMEPVYQPPVGASDLLEPLSNKTTGPNGQWTYRSDAKGDNGPYDPNDPFSHDIL